MNPVSEPSLTNLTSVEKNDVSMPTREEDRGPVEKKVSNSLTSVLQEPPQVEMQDTRGNKARKVGKRSSHGKSSKKTSKQKFIIEDIDKSSCHKSVSRLGP